MGVLKMDHGNSILLAENILKKYGNKIVLNTISFDVIRGEFLSVLGPSGCGKTTLLRCLIGIEEVDSGSFIKNGEDIPMSALDTDIKMSLRKLIKKIQSERKITMIYITHDQEEAFSLSDRIMVMRNGTIEQMGTPKDIYYHPKDEFVKSFIVNNLDEKVRLIQSSIQ